MMTRLGSLVVISIRLKGLGFGRVRIWAALDA
jgi:hypothetical protein